MSLLRVFARRIAFGVVTAWAVLTTVFLTFTQTPDWVAQQIAAGAGGAGITIGMNPEHAPDMDERQANVQAALADYMESRGFDRPLHEQYVDWMGDMLTLNWGTSFATSEEVFPMVTDATVRTAMYVVPSVVLAVLIGTLIGLYAALSDSWLAKSSRLSAYAVFAVPSFWIGGMFISASRGGIIGDSPLLFDHVLPIALVTMTLLGGYVSYSRAYAKEFVSADFVMLVRAKGAGPVRVARHVLRNAAIPLVAMLFTEALGLLVLGIFVTEVLFGIDGFGIVFFDAVDERDLPVLLGSALVIILVAVLGNVIQDLSYHYLDPRVEE